MRGAERIVIALGALGEAGQAAAGAQRADPVAAAGEDLVRIGLVADVPDQAIARRVEDVMQGGGQLDHAETGAEMSARYRNRIDGFLTQFVGNLPDLLHLEPRKSSGVRIVSRSGVLLNAVTVLFQFCQGRDQRPDRKWVAQN